jgi:hypothetical protein
LKTSRQVIAELEGLRARKMAIVFIVDDNLIGNKKAIKPLLRDVIAWQRAEGYPLTFFTEASLDLAEDQELMTREEPRDGYLQLMQDLYDPDAYFERLEDLYLRDNFQVGPGRARYWREHPWSHIKGQTRHLAISAYLYFRLMYVVPDATLRREYRRRIVRLLKVRRDPVVLFVYLIKCAAHHHHYTMATQMARRETQVVNSFRWNTVEINRPSVRRADMPDTASPHTPRPLSSASRRLMSASQTRPDPRMPRSLFFRPCRHHARGEAGV